MTDGSGSLAHRGQEVNEEFVNYHLPAKFFVGLAVDESAPDHSTLAVFKRRMLEKDEDKAFRFRFLFDQVVRLAQERGVKFGEVQCYGRNCLPRSWRG